MAEDTIKSPPTFTGSNRRAFERHPVDIIAQISVTGSLEIQRKIKDFCIGGMLLVDEQQSPAVEVLTTYQLKEGDLIDIRFSIDETEASNDAQYCLHARVVREDAESSGVALLEPDLVVIQSLMDFAKLARNNQNNEINPTAACSTNTDVIAECTELVVSYLIPLSVKTHDTIVASLFEKSKSLKNIAEQNMYFETLGVLNDNKDNFITIFNENAIARMACCQNGEILDTNNDSEAFSENTTELAIVEEEVLDNWLADTGTIESVQRTHSGLLTQLNRRLSELFAVPIDKENNPYGPVLFTHAFHEAISSFGLHHKVTLVCHKAFKSLLISMLGELYEKLNSYLVERDVLPNLTYEIPHATEHVAETPEQFDLSVPENNDFEEVAQEASQESSDDNSISDEVKHQNIYELVAELRTLKRQLHKQSSEPREITGNDDGQAKETGSVKTGVALTQNEVLQTLSRIESSCRSLNREDFKELIYSSLSGEVDDDGNKKVVASRENQIIDVSSSIFDSILTDVQVPANMHDWLSKMEIPVLKMAIEDDSLFMDRDHLVRKVVNKIAQLGLLIGEEESEGTSGVRKALDWLVDLIGSDFDGTLSVFGRVSDQLDLLITAQDKKYEDKIKLVINEFEEDIGEETEVVPDLEKEFQSEEDYAKWLRRAKRLEEGDWVLFDLDTEDNKRLRAAWIAQHTGKIVFVDAVGNKDRVVFIEELAVLLHKGKAMTLDDANEPAMDRAQYSMLQELNKQLVYESTHDPLTGLINRREFEKKIGKALISSRHTDIRHALLFVDLDQFNVINTTYGYEAGDRLLIETSKIFAETQGHSCVLARLGSDEFGLLLEDIDLEESLEISDEYIHQAREHKFIWDDRRVSTGMSIGLVTINSQSESITSLMQNAESSCGLAKDMGGNRTQLYRSGQTRFSHRSEIINWVSQIDDILDNGRLRLRCQKILPIALNSKDKRHYEILLVLVDEHGESISIQNFIEAAEWSNRITDIDRWVIKESLVWISNNKSILDSVDSFSINLSGRSLSDERLVDYIVDEIKSSGVPPSALCFEITETIGVESLSDSADFINRIKETGCHFSLDDFGSGMSSYAYLKNLPVDYLKIDGTFIKEMGTSISDYAVVKSICEIGHFMGKRVIAEYVENDKILTMLTEIGVDFVQGFGIEKPLMINELLAAR